STRTAPAARPASWSAATTARSTARRSRPASVAPGGQRMLPTGSIRPSTEHEEDTVVRDANPRQVRDVVFVAGVRTPFGKAGGLSAPARADGLVVRCLRELLRRNPQVPPEQVDEVAIAATTQIGDQGLTLGRSAALLAGLPATVPGFAVDRMCAGAMTAVTSVAGGIATGALEIALAGGVEHMGRHPMGEGVDPNPRFQAEALVDRSALVMGATAENLHDRLPHLTRERADAYALASQEKTAKAYANGKLQP